MDERIGLSLTSEEAPDLLGGGFVCDGEQGVRILLRSLPQPRTLPKCSSRRWRVAGRRRGWRRSSLVAVAHLAALAVVGDGEAVALVADLLDQVQHGRAAVEDHGLVLLPVDVDDLFALGDGGERLQGDAELFERSVRGVQLAEAAVDEDERGKRLSCRRSRRL